MTGLAPCLLCKQAFMFDPETVNSLPIDPETGLPPDIGDTDPQKAVKMPVCPACVGCVNVSRREQGLPEWTVTGEIQ